MLFWRLFQWPASLGSLSPGNRGIMQVLNLCLTFLFLALGILVMIDRKEILATSLGHHLLVMLALFWLLRLIEQFVFLSLKPRLSQVLTVLFALGTVIYAVPVLAP